MRRIRYTATAARELDAILDYIASRSPTGTRKVKARIAAVIDHLAEWPEAGAASRNRPGMRRAFALPYPYSIDYRFTENELVIFDIRHTARRPRPG